MAFVEEIIKFIQDESQEATWSYPSEAAYAACPTSGSVCGYCGKKYGLVNVSDAAKTAQALKVQHVHLCASKYHKNKGEPTSLDTHSSTYYSC